MTSTWLTEMRGRFAILWIAVLCTVGSSAALIAVYALGERFGPAGIVVGVSVWFTVAIPWIVFQFAIVGDFVLYLLAGKVLLLPIIRTLGNGDSRVRSFDRVVRMLASLSLLVNPLMPLSVILATQLCAAEPMKTCDPLLRELRARSLRFKKVRQTALVVSDSLDSQLSSMAPAMYWMSQSASS